MIPSSPWGIIGLIVAVILLIVIVKEVIIPLLHTIL